jgi:hypothetical protein
MPGSPVRLTVKNKKIKHLIEVRAPFFQHVRWCEAIRTFRRVRGITRGLHRVTSAPCNTKENVGSSFVLNVA